MTDDPGACTERELTDPVSLCRPDGTLAPEAVGWARQPLVDCTLPGRWGRRKRWDFWSVVGPGFAMNLTYADVDYVGLGSVWFRDLEQGDEAAADVAVPLAGISLPDLLVVANLASSRSVGRRLVRQGGVRVDGEVQTDENRMFEAGISHEVRVGKRNAARVRLT